MRLGRVNFNSSFHNYVFIYSVLQLFKDVFVNVKEPGPHSQYTTKILKLDTNSKTFWKEIEDMAKWGERRKNFFFFFSPLLLT